MAEEDVGMVQRKEEVRIKTSGLMCRGDFNMVLNNEERRGCAISTSGISEFYDFVEVAALIDVLMHGKRFTWIDSGARWVIDDYQAWFIVRAKMDLD
ncbi:hypothetical protein V6N12_064381 [Hibiscus sabdariffa]|uniref:Uncharacterized protein n=1 Tax=Hibiscus sabdariffa TaxID=183260 RepID=A0ABR2G5L9_9ROSI